MTDILSYRLPFAVFIVCFSRLSFVNKVEMFQKLFEFSTQIFGGMGRNAYLCNRFRQKTGGERKSSLKRFT